MQSLIDAENKGPREITRKVSVPLFFPDHEHRLPALTINRCEGDRWTRKAVASQVPWLLRGHRSPIGCANRLKERIHGVLVCERCNGFGEHPFALLLRQHQLA